MIMHPFFRIYIFTVMNKFINPYSSILLLIIAVLLGSCKGKDDKAPIDGYFMVTTSEDTVTVSQLAVDFMEKLKSKDINGALDMLYYLNEPADSLSQPTITPLNDEQIVQQQLIFDCFPVLAYRIDNIIFRTETDCQVKCTFDFSQPDDGQGNPLSTSLYLQPMRLEGKWYLTVRDSSTPSGMYSGIKN